MKKYIRYQSRSDLKRLRKLFEYKIDDIVEYLFCSRRTFERIERDNGTSNIYLANRIAELYLQRFAELFIEIDLKTIKFINSIREYTLSTENSYIIENEVYYYIFLKKLDTCRDQIWGSTYWLEDYNKYKDIRKLREVNVVYLLKNTNHKITIINTESQWYRTYFGLCIGKLHEILISKSCAEKCIPDILKRHVVESRLLFNNSKISDLMLLGKYNDKRNILID
ncbi:TPA: hypothetical protein KNN84_002027 [Clostridioides difficile]|nr:hypothetical protein [Clostridioides difficile]